MKKTLKLKSMILYTLLTALGGIVGMMLAWVAVQRLWGHVFAEARDEHEEDMLAQRGACGQCGCAAACSRKLPTPHTLSYSKQQSATEALP